MIRRKRNGYIFVQFLVLTVFLAFTTGLSSANPENEIEASVLNSHVVVIHSYHYGLNWSDSISDGIKQVFEKDAKDTKLKFEFLDTRFHNSKNYLDSIRDALKIKYSEQQVNVVIVVDDHALYFMRTYGKEIFGDVPVVFCSVSGYKPEMREELQLTGLRESIDIRSTVETALLLHPATEEIAVILEGSRTSLSFVTKVEEMLQEFEDRVQINFLKDPTDKRLKTIIPDLPENTIILLFVFRSDETGPLLSHDQYLDNFRQICPFPIYAVWQIYLGHGIIGGRLTNGEEEGRMVAHMALRVLKGEKANEIPFEESPVQYMFDYSELNRFEIDTELLPEESIIINKPISFYELNKTLIWEIIAAFSLLILTLLGLTYGLIRSREATKRILRSEENLRTTLYSIGDAVISTDKKGNIVRMNPVAEDLTGWTLAETKGKPLSDIFKIFNSLTKEPSIDPVKKVLESNETVGMANHTTLVSRDGIEYQIADSAAPIKDSGGKTSGVVLVFRNVTEEYRLRQQSRELAEMVKQTPAGVTIASLEGVVKYVNPAMISMLGYNEKEEIVGNHLGMFYEERQLETKIIPTMEVLKEVGHFSGEVDFLKKDGNLFPALINVRLLKDENGVPYAFGGFAQDILDRKKTEEALRESEENLRTTLYSIGDAVISTDTEGNIVRMNPIAETLTGWTLDESRGKPLSNIFKTYNSLTKEAALDPVTKVLETNEIVSLANHTTLIDRNGVEYQIADSAAPIKDSDGKTSGVVLVFRDVTEEYQLRHQSRELAKTVEQSPAGIVIASLDGIVQYVNPAMTSMIGYDDKDEIVGNHLGTIHPEELLDTKILPAIKKISEEGHFSGEVVYQKKNGTTIPSYLNVYLLKDDNGIPYAMGGFAQDITERKKAEAALIESENRYKAVSELTSEFAYAFRIEPDGKLVNEWVTGALARSTGYSRRELIQIGSWEHLIHPDDNSIPWQQLDKLKSNHSSTVEYRMVTKAGKTIWMRDYAKPIWSDEENRVIRIEGAIQDITERKLAEEALRQSEENLRTTLYSIGDAVISTDTEGNIVRMNPIAETLTGWTLDESRGKPLSNIFKTYNSLTKEAALDPVTKVLETNEIVSLANHTTLINRNGTEYQIADSAAPIKDSDGKTSGVVLVFRDVTEEYRLRQQSRELAKIVEQSPEGIAIAGLDGTLRYVNQAWIQMYGYSKKEEIVGNNLAMFHPIELMDTMVIPAMEEVKKGGKFSGEVDFLTKDGSIIQTYLSVYLLKDENGMPYALGGFAQDIAERKQVEGALKQSEAKFRGLVESTIDWIWEINSEGQYTYCSPQVESILGYKSEEILGKKPFDLMPTEESQRIEELYNNYRAAGEPIISLENINLHKDGRKIVIETSGVPVMNENGDVVGFRGVDRDISERKQAEERLRIFQAAVDASTDAIGMSTSEGKHYYQNEAFDKLFGETGEDPPATLYADEPVGREVFQTIMDGGQWIGEVQMRGSNGKILDILLRAYSIKDESGKVVNLIGVHTDITESKQAEEELRKSEARFRATVEASPMGMHFYELNENGQLIFSAANKTADKILGVDNSVFVGKSIEEAFPPLVETEVPHRYKEAAAEGKSWTTQQIDYDEGGIRGAFEVVAFQTEPNRMVALFNDITQRKRAEEELQASEERLSKFINSADTSFHILDSDFNILEINSKAMEYVSIADPNLKTRGDVVGKNFFEIYPNVEEETKHFANVLETGEKFENEFKTTHPVLGELVINSLRFRVGSGLGIIAQDITDKKKAENALLESERLLRLMADNYPNSYVSIINSDLTVGFTSGREFKKQDLDPEQYIGLTLDEVFKEDAELVKQEYCKAFNGEECSFELSVGDQKQSYNAVPLYSEDGSISRILAVAENITERKEAEEALIESRKMLREVLDTIPVRVFWKNRESVYLGCNRLFAEDAGRSHYNDVIGDTDYNMGWAEQAELYRSDDEYVMSTGEAKINYEEPQTTPSGDKIWLKTSKVPLRDKNGEVYGILGTYEDITVQKNAEEAVKESQKMLREVLDTIPVRVFWKNRDSVYLGCNRLYAQDAGKNHPDEVIGLTDYDLGFHQADLFRSDDAYVMNSGESKLSYEEPQSTEEIDLIWVRTSKVPLRKANGEIFGVLGTYEDITERKAAEEKLREAQEFLEAAVAQSPSGILIADAPDVKIRLGNPAAFNMRGGDPGILTGIDVEQHSINWQTFRPDGSTYPPEELPLSRAVLKGEMTRGEEVIIRDEEGIDHWVMVNAAPILDSNGQVTAGMVVFQDISDRKIAENELRQLRNYLSNIIDSMPSVLVGVDNDGKVTQWNREAERSTGISPEDAVGKSLEETFPRMASEMDRVREAMQNKAVRSDSRQSHSEGGELRYEDLIVYPLVADNIEGAVIRLDDVTDRVRMEEMMIQSEKMLSVGGLAAGMAHEINNPLAGMIQTASVMKDRLTNIEMPANLRAAEDVGTTLETIFKFMEVREIPRMLDHIRHSGSRAAEIVSNMLSFARKGDSSYSTYNLEELLDQSVDLAGSDYDLRKKYDFRKIEVVREYEKNLPTVPCEAGKIQQVFLNILRNGAEAMRETMEQDATKISRFFLRLAHEKNTGKVRIEIEDNGPGMDESIRKRIFEPFFTTKPTDQGTGLGLSVSYFIVTENYGGEMSAESTPGEGSKFIIRLPLERKK